MIKWLMTLRGQPRRGAATPRPQCQAAGRRDQRGAVFVAENFQRLARRDGYLTEPAVMPATRNRCSSRKPTTIGTLTVSDAAMIWFQYTWFWVA